MNGIGTVPPVVRERVVGVVVREDDDGVGEQDKVPGLALPPDVHEGHEEDVSQSGHVGALVVLDRSRSQDLQLHLLLLAHLLQRFLHTHTHDRGHYFHHTLSTESELL